MSRFFIPACLILVLACPALATTTDGLIAEPLRASAATQDSPPPSAAAVVSGTVVETMAAASYTYARVDTADGELWIAGPETELAVGDQVSFRRGTPMKGFRSRALDRTFESIDFVEAISVGDRPVPAASAGGSKPASDDAAAAHGTIGGTASDVDVSGIERAAGGLTVAEILDGKATLAGKEAVVRAKVVKSTPSVMQRNWLHVRDGSATASGGNDLTVTTQDRARVGDTVLVRGKVATDKDFGFGYEYDVLLEEASVTVE